MTTAIALFSMAAVAQALMVELPLDTVTRLSERVVVADVLSLDVVNEPTGEGSGVAGGITTVVDLKVVEQITGSGTDSITLKIPGGRVGRVTRVVEDTPRFTPGGRYIVFLDGKGGVTGWRQGALRVIDGQVIALDRPLADVERGVRAAAGGAQPRSLQPIAQSVRPVTVASQMPTLSLSPVAARPPVASAATRAHTNLINDGFEGSWKWSTGGSPTWKITTHRDNGGAHSAYCAQSTTAAPGPYANNMYAWMQKTVNLSDATIAVLDFDVWFNIASGDGWRYELSTDGKNWGSAGWTGSTGGWWHHQIDLRDAPAAGGGTRNYCGQSTVYIRFLFHTDSSGTAEGAYMDNVVLWKNTGLAPSITSITPGTASAGTDSTVTIAGNDFGASQGTGKVEFFGPEIDKVSAPITSWSNTSIVCTVPTGMVNTWPASAGSGPVTVTDANGNPSLGYDFTVTFGFAGRRCPGPAVALRLNSNCADTTDETALVDAAWQTWNAPSRFSFDRVGTNTRTSLPNSYDSYTDIFWMPSGLDPSFLGLTQYWYMGRTLVDWDIALNDADFNWGDGNGSTWDIQTIILHALGNGLGLVSLYGAGDSGKAMYSGNLHAGPSGVRRSLQAGDEAGIVWLYGAVSGSMAINNGDAWTATPGVTLTLTPSGMGTVTEMRFSDDCSNWTSWEPYAATRDYTLSAGDSAAKTVWVQFKNSVGDVKWGSDAIGLDTTPPTTADDAPPGWSQDYVLLTLGAADDVSETVTTHYRLDGGAWQTGSSLTIVAALDKSGDGIHVVDYYSTDPAGNVEVQRSCQVKIYVPATVEPVTVLDSSGHQRCPSLSGGTVVWQDDRDGGWDIYGSALILPLEFPICTAAGDQTGPAISGDTVVWVDGRGSDLDIRGYSLSSSTESAICSAAGDQTEVAISGDTVVWADHRGTSWDIYGYDLATKTEFPVCTAAGDQSHPAVSGSTIVWADHRGTSWDIYGYDLDTATGSSISTVAGDQTQPAISGDRVIWNDTRGAVFAYDLDSHREYSLGLPGDSERVMSGGLVAWSDAAGALVFAPHFQYALAAFPTSVVRGDFNADGRQDLVTADYGASTVSVLLGRGDGTFAVRTGYPTGAAPWSVAVGDFNADDKQDLVTANCGADTVSVLLGNGDGTFAAKTDYPTGSGPCSVAVGDFDADGRQDLATANYGAGTISVLFGRGVDGFEEGADYPTGAAPWSIAVGDFDSDGNADLVTADSGDDTVSVLLGRGDEPLPNPAANAFAARTAYPTGAAPCSVAVGDFDSDGRQDLATANQDANTVSVLLGSDAGGVDARTDYATDSCPYSVAVGDVDSDGKDDLATANNTGGTVRVLLGDGAGGFPSRTDYRTGAAPLSVVVGDFDADGRQDLATANYNAGTASVLLGRAPGVSVYNIETGSTQRVRDSEDAAGVACPPALDGDTVMWANHGVHGAKLTYPVWSADITIESTAEWTKDTDVTVQMSATSSEAAIEDVALSRDGITFGAWQTYEASTSYAFPAGSGAFAARTDHTSGGHPYAVAVGDFDSDGVQDLASVNYSADTVSVSLGNGDGTFAAATDYATGAAPRSVAVGDFDRDGKQDLVTADSGNGTVSVLLGHGDGTFAARTGFATGAGPCSVAVSDLDSDTKQDLVTANTTGNTVSVLLGHGDGSFAAKSDHATGAAPRSVAVGDFDGDGAQDLATADYDSRTVSVLPGNGDGSFAARSGYATGAAPRSVAVGDFDSDGDQDLVTANDIDDTVSVLLGHGDGSFAAKTDYPAGAGSCSVVGGDFHTDGQPDGRQDLAVSNSDDDTVSMLLGNGDGTFGVKVDYDVGATPCSIAAGAINANGRQDLAVADSGADTISVLLDPSAGQQTVYAVFRDAAGGVSSVASDVIGIDTKPPTTTIVSGAGFSRRWCTEPPDFGFGASDGASGVSHIEYKIDDGPWTDGDHAVVPAPADHSNDGVHVVCYRSVDVAGNVESEQSTEACIDTRKPITQAPSRAGVRRGKIATLKYKVTDLAPNGGTASVIIKVKTLGGRTVKTLKLGTKPVNVARSATFRCRLAKKTYKFFVYATDTAGNKQAVAGRNRLTVR